MKKRWLPYLLSALMMFGAAGYAGADIVRAEEIHNIKKETTPANTEEHSITINAGEGGVFAEDAEYSDNVTRVDDKTLVASFKKGDSINFSENIIASSTDAICVGAMFEDGSVVGQDIGCALMGFPVEISKQLYVSADTSATLLWKSPSDSGDEYFSKITVKTNGGNYINNESNDDIVTFCSKDTKVEDIIRSAFREGYYMEGWTIEEGPDVIKGKVLYPYAVPDELNVAIDCDLVMSANWENDAEFDLTLNAGEHGDIVTLKETFYDESYGQNYSIDSRVDSYTIKAGNLSVLNPTNLLDHNVYIVPESDDYTFCGWKLDDGLILGYSDYSSELLQGNRSATGIWKKKTDAGDDDFAKITIKTDGGTLYLYGGIKQEPFNGTPTVIDDEEVFFIVKETPFNFALLGEKTGYSQNGFKIIEGENAGAVLTFSELSSLEPNSDMVLSVVWKPTGRKGWIKEDGTWYYFVDNEVYEGDTILAQGTIDGKTGWFAATDGKFNKSFTGIAKATNGKWYFAKNGVLTRSFSGIAQATNGIWYYIKNGVIDRTFSGKIAQATNGKWYYVNKGKPTKTFTGKIAQTTDGRWYYCTNGRPDVKFSGKLAYCTTGDWYYVTKGKIDRSYTGIAEATNGKLYYTKKGKLDRTFSGNASYNGKTYKVVNGVVKQ